MPTVISIYDDETGAPLEHFMVIDKPKRSWVDVYGLITGLLLSPIVFNWFRF